MWRTLCFYRNVLLDTAQCDQRVRDLPSDEPPLEDAPNHDDTDAGRDVDDLPYADDGVAAAGAAGASTGAGRDVDDLPYVGAGTAGAAWWTTTGARGAAHAVAIDNIAISRNGAGAGGRRAAVAPVRPRQRVVDGRVGGVAGVYPARVLWRRGVGGAQVDAQARHGGQRDAKQDDRAEDGEDRAALVRGRQQRVLDAAADREVVRVAGKVVALARDGKAAEARRAVRRRALPVHVRAVPAGVGEEEAARGPGRPAGLRHLRHGRGAPAGGHPARLKGQARDVAQKHALRFRRGAQRKEREDQPRAKNRHVEWRACRAPRRAA